MRSKRLKVLLSWMIVLICIWNCGMNVFAASINEMTKEELLENYSVDTGNEEADKLFNTFLEKTSSLTQEGYSHYFDNYERMSDVYVSRFVKCCNGTEEDWKNKDTIEQYLWTTTYMVPLEGLMNFDWNYLVEDGGYYQMMVEMECSNFAKVDQELVDAYCAVMDWQYNYLCENSAVYNFMTGEDSLGNTQIDKSDKGEPEAGEESKEVPELKEESEKETSVVEESKEESKKEASAIEKSEEIGEDTVESEKSYGAIIAILGVLVVVLIGVVVYLKKKS